MVYRYESGEDSQLESPRPGTDLSVLSDRPARTGPSPSRFPTPSLPQPVRPVRSASARPVPVEARAVAEPAPPRVQHVAEPAPVRTPEHDEGYPPGRALGPAHGYRTAGGRNWQVLVGGAAVLALFALTGLAAAALFVDRTPQTPVAPAGAPVTSPPVAVERQDIDSRDTDQAPLTSREVFPKKELTIGPAQSTYRVLKTQSSGSCATAATGEVADLLARLGCSQVVRATLRSPDGTYLVTAGLLNLPDLTNAERARDRIRDVLDDRQGRFRGLPAGDDTAALTSAPARVGWQVRGHYLAYSLVVRADGAPISADDQAVRDVLFDLIELHLDQEVLERRANGGTAGQPTSGVNGDRTGDEAGDVDQAAPDAGRRDDGSRTRQDD
ncbi:hypothetical protein [Micromonospora rosaria]|uniref:hypothetical protein n=1 Tax=Micromonospora rosaria TaxID=47874 RepID=UPI0008373030|nr:hypothetical protein [Micromonospora rosaria]